jgi:hypothetical protein
MNLASAALVSALVFAPFGPVSSHLKDESPWFGFDASQGPVLTLVRAQVVSKASCTAWSQALTEVPPGWTPLETSPIKQTWAGWSKKDIDGIQACDDFPCKVKLDQAEVGEMKKAPKEQRIDRYLDLVMKRIEEYRKTETRREYEVSGAPVDPWANLEKHGYQGSLARPDRPLLFSRVFDFSSDERVQPLHQILDRRVARKSDGSNAEVWVRDAYTDHYFDSWGEWDDFVCDPKTGDAVVVLVLQGEMDFLKKTDILSRGYASKYRELFEDNGKKYLNARFERVKKAATGQPALNPGQKGPADTK